MVTFNVTIAFFLPTADIGFPFAIFVQMPAENIHGIGWRLLGRMMQMHVYFLCFASAFTVIAIWTSRHHICPRVCAAHVPWNDMIDS